MRHLTFELHHGKRILMCETFRNAGSGLVPEHIALDDIQTLSKAVKRKLSSSSGSENLGPAGDSDGLMPRKRSTVMSLNNLISERPSSPSIKVESAFVSTPPSADPSSPTAAVVPLSPTSYEREREEANMRPRNKSLSFDDHAPSSWNYSTKESLSGSERAEDGQAKTASSASTSSGTRAAPAKTSKKRQEPPELSELGIGQRASANLHAAYVNGQMKERSKAGLPTDSTMVLPDAAKAKSTSSKPKPSHTCPEPDCDKSFSRLFNLRSHMRTHSKARPFVCSSCNFAFSRRHDRDRHAKKHLSEKPYKCIVCEATFVRQDALVRHLRMDGVQNACMAAMEQRSMPLGENGGGYMLAAKQQAHDEQQQEDKRDADEKQNVQSGLQGPCHHESSKTRHSSKKGDENAQENRMAKAELSGINSERAKIDKDGIRLLESIQQAAAQANRELSGAVKIEHPGERLSQKPVFSRPPSPHQDKSSTDSSYETKQHPYATSSRQGHERGLGSQDYAGDERYSSMHSSQRSFYPSPSRSHSRSHSQSQLYSAVPEHAPTGYYDHAPPAYGSSYHGSQHKYPAVAPHAYPPSYRDQPGYAYSTSSSSPSSSAPRYHDRPQADQHGTDAYGGYSSRESHGRVSEGAGSGGQGWTNAGFEMHGDPSDLEADKSIFEAAMGLLRIRASQW
ncbi:hypothetical protein BGX28_007415 [Mortierella sp. GBA30]|nr:hypothetical protein BGX28_007415 [Mortierella sp. GBA30]